VRTSIAVGQENKLLEVQHPHAAQEAIDRGGETTVESIASPIMLRNTRPGELSPRQALDLVNRLKGLGQGKSAGIGFPGRREDTAKNAIPGHPATEPVPASP